MSKINKKSQQKMADKQQQCTAYVCGDVVARGDVVVLVEMWWLCGDVVAHW